MEIGINVRKRAQKRGVGIFPHGYEAINVIRHPPTTPTDHRHRTYPLANINSTSHIVISTFLFCGMYM